MFKTTRRNITDYYCTATRKLNISHCAILTVRLFHDDNCLVLESISAQVLISLSKVTDSGQRINQMIRQIMLRNKQKLRLFFVVNNWNYNKINSADSATVKMQNTYYKQANSEYAPSIT